MVPVGKYSYHSGWAERIFNPSASMTRGTSAISSNFFNPFPVFGLQPRPGPKPMAVKGERSGGSLKRISD